MTLEADFDPSDPDFGDDEDMEVSVNACLEAQDRLLYALQGNASDNLLVLAIQGGLVDEIRDMEMTREIVELIADADWIDEGVELTSDEARDIVIAFIEGIAALFIYNRWPIDDGWIKRSDDLCPPVEIDELPLERQAETFVWYAGAKGVPQHLLQGMLEFCVLDIPPGPPN